MFETAHVFLCRRCPRMTGVGILATKTRRSHVGGCAAAVMSKLWGRWMMKVLTLTTVLRHPHRKPFALTRSSSNQQCTDPTLTHTGKADVPADAVRRCKLTAVKFYYLLLCYYHCAAVLMTLTLRLLKKPWTVWIYSVLVLPSASCSQRSCRTTP